MCVCVHACFAGIGFTSYGLMLGKHFQGSFLVFVVDSENTLGS